MERLANSPEWLWNVGMGCSQVYYQMGHQAVFGVHWEPEKRCHIHFAVNSINFIEALIIPQHSYHVVHSLLCLYQRSCLTLVIS